MRILYFDEDERLIIEEALQLLWEERGLDYLPINDAGKYYDPDYPDDARMANTISCLLERF